MVEFRTETFPKHVETIFQKKIPVGPNNGCLNPNV